MFKKLIIITKLMLIVFIVSSCTKNNREKASVKNNKLQKKVVKKVRKVEFTLKFSHVVSDDTPKGKAAKFFKKRLEELSNGRIDVQIYPNSELYKDNVVLNAVKEGSIQMACPSFSKFRDIVPQLALFDLPFLFRDMNHIHKVQDSEIGKKLKKMVENQGFTVLDFWDNGFKQMTSSKRALLLPEDAKGQKFRIMNSEVLKAQFKVLEAESEVMPFSKVYKALKNGLIDGQENTISNIYTKNFYKVQKYLTLTNHGYLGYLVVMNKDFYNSLPQELKKAVKQAMSEATEKERTYAGDLEIIQLNLIKKSAEIDIFELSPEQTEKWRNAVKGIYEQFYDDKKIGKKLIQAVADLR